MARGWESKSVEAQQEAASQLPDGKRRLSPDQMTVFRQRQGLLLSRTAVQRRLATVQNPRQRIMLESALADLEEKLAKLEHELPQNSEQ